VEYLQPRIASIFQRAIGLNENRSPSREVALLGSIIMLNRYVFTDIKLPGTINLSITPGDGAGDLVAKGNQHFGELLGKLREFCTAPDFLDTVIAILNPMSWSARSVIGARGATVCVEFVRAPVDRSACMDSRRRHAAS
jgi:hypothetical protein